MYVMLKLGIRRFRNSRVYTHKNGLSQPSVPVSKSAVMKLDVIHSYATGKGRV
jgi:hypothetical protein